MILVALAFACVVVGLMWGLRWAFEDGVAAGRMTPDEALQAMASFVSMLYGVAAMVAALLAVLLAWIGKRTRETRQWPPSGSWPKPRAIGEIEISRYVLRLRMGALAAGALAIAALVAVLT